MCINPRICKLRGTHTVVLGVIWLSQVKIVSYLSIFDPALRHWSLTAHWFCLFSLNSSGNRQYWTSQWLCSANGLKLSSSIFVSEKKPTFRHWRNNEWHRIQFYCSRWRLVGRRNNSRQRKAHMKSCCSSVLKRDYLWISSNISDLLKSENDKLSEEPVIILS